MLHTGRFYYATLVVSCLLLSLAAEVLATNSATETKVSVRAVPRSKQ